MRKRTKATFSLVLVLCLLLSLLSGTSPAVAAESSEAPTSTATETPTVESETSDVTDIPPTLLQEAVSLRGEYEKHFIMSDGSYQVALYNEPVHQLVNGEWVEIDNTLALQTATDGTAMYATANGLTDVRFAQSFDDQLVTMSQGEYKVSWGVQAVSNSLSATKSVRLIQAELVTDELSVFSAEEQMTMATKSSSTIHYRDALMSDVDLEYIVLPSRVKENIILQSPQDISGYVVTVYTENLSARLLENRRIEFYDSSDEVIFTMTSPYMYDSAGELSEDIAVEMVSKGSGCYFISMTPNAQWLSDESRVYPVVIDPQVTTDSARTNIVDNYVLEGADVQNNNLDRLYIGNRSGGRNRAYVKFATMPTIPSGATISSATMTLNLVSGTSTGYTVNAYQITRNWASDTIKWSNRPTASISLATNISHNSLTKYRFSCLTAVQSWYDGSPTGQNANYGIMLRYYDETKADYNSVYSADHSVENQRPKMVIIYNLNPFYTPSSDMDYYCNTVQKNEPSSSIDGKMVQICADDGLQSRSNCYGYAFRFYYGEDDFYIEMLRHQTMMGSKIYTYKQIPGEFANKANGLTLTDAGVGSITIDNYGDLLSFYHNSLFKKAFMTNTQRMNYLVQLMQADANTIGYTMTEWTDTSIPNANAFGDRRLIAIVVSDTDYHFYMQHSDNTWSHKLGGDAATSQTIDCGIPLTNATIRNHACEGAYLGGALKFFLISKDAIIDRCHTRGSVATNTRTIFDNSERAGNHLTSAKSIGTVPQTFTNSVIDYVGDIDFYSFMSNASQTCTITGSMDDGTSILLKLYDCHGTLLFTRQGTGTASFTYSLSVGKSYYLSIEAVNQTTHQRNKQYDFSITIS